MIKAWQLQDAKNRFSKVIEDAQSSGPQIITKRGKEVAVVLSFSEYQKGIASKTKLSTFFLDSPLANMELDLSRDKSPIREGLSL